MSVLLWLQMVRDLLALASSYIVASYTRDRMLTDGETVP